VAVVDGSTVVRLGSVVVSIVVDRDEVGASVFVVVTVVTPLVVVVVG
jgi:hypothetical protein